MLSFEWQTQGRPLNSFIVGFKTLHFKKYKSYSQMNEGERGDWREGLLMCPVGRHELNLSPQAAQIHSPVRLRLCPRDPTLHTWHPVCYPNFLQTLFHTNSGVLWPCTMKILLNVNFPQILSKQTVRKYNSGMDNLEFIYQNIGNTGVCCFLIEMACFIVSPVTVVNMLTISISLLEYFSFSDSIT